MHKINYDSTEVAQEMLNAYTNAIFDSVDSLWQLDERNECRIVSESNGKWKPRPGYEIWGQYYLLKRLARAWLDYNDQQILDEKMVSFLQDHCALLESTDISKEYKKEEE